MSKILHGHRTELNKTKQKGQKRRQSVVAGRQQLYCAVQSRSPSHCSVYVQTRAPLEQSKHRKRNS